MAITLVPGASPRLLVGGYRCCRSPVLARHRLIHRIGELCTEVWIERPDYDDPGRRGRGRPCAKTAGVRRADEQGAKRAAGAAGSRIATRWGSGADRATACDGQAHRARTARAAA